ncbi:nickel pincer cofactor biosynthesis protein LarB [Paenibacillus montanisoli]|uniref:Nickel pincer cofactor biosynthesis protein LarB n=1 Tax=Paenibacillus montanisoli TaxID=2081970 RepID=A0A328U961_9BACL|nr:nickel pincer cofactor biosynthesis protein LarB [Paenibacillus montanisoli]RAP76596.1 nickel pincer cofactor biosynthesis protein LarB [Paenibacillus montanisoli]
MNHESAHDFATLDTAREKRLGFPEVVYGEGKTAEQLVSIANRMKEFSDKLIMTRVDAAKAALVIEQVPQIKHHPDAQMLTGFGEALPPAAREGYIAVVCAGTSDLRAAEEASVTLEMMGSRVERVTDVGVAGIHRLFKRLDVISGADVVIAIAGMEGALPSVLGGLIAKPLIAVPTSIGYGTGLHGLIALGAMLNSCAPGITVVNIDNGFGAAYAAANIHKSIRMER